MHPWVGLSDHVRLGAVARWVTPELVAEALTDCAVKDKKPGALPARFMVYFTLALALFQQDSYDDVAEHMVGGVPELGQSIPNKSSFTRARQRLGARAVERVFRKLAGPLAPAGLEQVRMAWWPPWSDEMLTAARRAWSPSRYWSAQSP
jgi:Insertion element 4 transposase N-terminal